MVLGRTGAALFPTLSERRDVPVRLVVRRVGGGLVMLTSLRVVGKRVCRGWGARRRRRNHTPR